MQSRPHILEHAATLSEPTRCRLLQLLDRHELTVSELCSVLQLPQSTASRHLKVLGDAGWVRSRREGTSHLYQLAADVLEESAQQMWALIREQVMDTAMAQQDRQRLEGLLQQRRSRSQEFFSSTADQWDKLRDELFGRRFDLLALLALVDRRWTVGDFGCGTGRISEALAPHVEQVIAVDGSDAMLAAAGQRLERFSNVKLRQGYLERLPIDDHKLDAATLFLALHHQSAPGKVLAEAHRVLKPGGHLLVVDMLPHERDDYRQQMGHVWLGFSAEQLTGALKSHGFEEPRFQTLPVDAEAKGPGLFVATALAGEKLSNLGNEKESTQEVFELTPVLT